EEPGRAGAVARPSARRRRPAAGDGRQGPAAGRGVRLGPGGAAGAELLRAAAVRARPRPSEPRPPRAEPEPLNGSLPLSRFTLLPRTAPRRVLDPIVGAIARTGITPNGVSAIGFAGNGVAALLA